MFRPKLGILLITISIAISLTSPFVAACPFCSAVTQTLSEEMRSMDAAVIAGLIELPANSAAPSRLGQATPKARFQVVRVLKGTDLVTAGAVFESTLLTQSETGTPFLVLAAGSDKLAWSAPLALTPRGRDYVAHLIDLPEKGVKRLAYFVNYLEDREDLLAQDAYDEFARAPYRDVVELKDHLKRAQILKWIEDPEVSSSRRRLYLTMLGVCGTDEDLPMLEKMLRSDDRKLKAGLDAVIACYIKLDGPRAMPMIEDLFLKNKKAEYADTYAAVMALRFHGSETEIVPRERIVEGFRYLLERPDLADLVIPDLARWEDWTVIPQMMDLYKKADDRSSWVRVPVINYLRACPKPEASERLKQCEEIDPDAMKRANTFFPFPSETPQN